MASGRCRHRIGWRRRRFWLPFGKRKTADITFPLAPTFKAHEIDAVHGEAIHLDLADKTVTTSAGVHGYDYLVIATGYRNDHTVVPGLGPGGNAHGTTTLEDAIRADEGWRRLLTAPGDIVVGATQGAGCFGAAYEFLFNVAHQLRRAGLNKQVKLSFVTPEPFLGHFGIGGLPHAESLLGMFMRKEGIASCTDVGIERVEKGRLLLADGRAVELAYAMVVPPFLAQEVVRAAARIADRGSRIADRGWQGLSHRIKVRGTYQTEAYDDVYAVGIAAAVSVPRQTSTPLGTPKTGFPTERMAHVAARNIAAQIRGEQPRAHEELGDMPAVCVMDAGNSGVSILADKMLPPRKHGVLIPGPPAHAMKLAFERYFLWKARHGYVSLP